jgi:hypothetical protein
MFEIDVFMTRCWACKYRKICANDWNNPELHKSYCRQDFKFQNGKFVIVAKSTRNRRARNENC